MAALLERIRAVPRQWVVAGSAVLVIVLVLALIVVIGGDDAGSIESADPVEAATTTSLSTDMTTSTSAAAPSSATSSVTTTVTTVAPTRGSASSVRIDYQAPVESDTPSFEGRTIPDEPTDEAPPVTITPPPWAASTRLTEQGHVVADVGCVEDLSVSSLDGFFAERVGPVLGWDYQHVYPLGGDRYLWLFQDAFLDHSGTKNTLGTARFIHNAAMIQDDLCFSLVHRGSAEKPLPFEVGDGTVDTRTKWLWPMGGELVDDRLFVFWAEMIKDPYDPDPPDGLGWHPRQVFLATYDADTLERLSWESPRNPGVTPIYGYAVSSDDTHTYLFGNTFEQNMIREGGFWNGPHSATRMYLARVPVGDITEWPEYRTADGWSPSPDDAVPIVERYYAENPMQPRYLDGQWVSATAVDGYWGDWFAIDVADQPWGPWTNVQFGDLIPRNADPKMNTYHAHLLPWRDGFGSLQITVSNNARNMLRDAWPNPHRYRPLVFFAPYAPTPTPTTTTSTTSTTTTVAPSTSTSAPTTAAPTTATPTTAAPTTTIASTTTTSSTTTTTAPTTTTTTTTTPSSTSTSTTSTSTTTTTSTTAPTSTTIAGDDEG